MTSDEERRNSLADQAAAWIPPWQRPTPPKEPTPDPAAADSDPAADAATRDSGPVAGDAATRDSDTAAGDAATSGPANAAGAANPDPATAASSSASRAEPEILDTYRSSGTGTVQDLAAATVSALPTGPATTRDGEPVESADVGVPGVERAGVGPDRVALRGDGEPAEPADAGVPGVEPAGVGRDLVALPDAGPDGAEPAGDLPAESTAAGVPGKRGRRRVTPAPEPAPVLDDAELRGALEAILLVVDEPVSELTLAQVLEQSPERIGPMLDEIAAGYTAAGHGFELRRAAGGWRLYTRPEYATYVERFVLDGQSVRLTQAALETLAVIAYRQPVTRSRIAAIRGVNSDGVIRTLVSRGLVEECGAEPDSGAFLYRTTTMFLEKLGLNSVADLPPLAPFLPDDVEELADATR